jgi:hypothetical protein
MWSPRGGTNQLNRLCSRYFVRVHNCHSSGMCPIFFETEAPTEPFLQLRNPGCASLSSPSTSAAGWPSPGSSVELACLPCAMIGPCLLKCREYTQFTKLNCSPCQIRYQQFQLVQRIKPLNHKTNRDSNKLESLRQAIGSTKFGMF